jgi:hypothetical protein
MNENGLRLLSRVSFERHWRGTELELARTGRLVTPVEPRLGHGIAEECLVTQRVPPRDGTRCVSKVLFRARELVAAAGLLTLVAPHNSP